MRLTRLAAAVLVLFGMGAGSAVHAEQFQPFDDYEVHYNAFNSSFLPPEVAQAYNIQRSKYGALLNVAVLQVGDNGKKPVRANVVGTLKNLMGQVQDLEFKEIEEGEAVYYIADFRFTNDEILSFDLKVVPAPTSSAYEISFRQHFYAD
ncbi:DUF4426 domain-containing protein [Motiliproteus sp. SC1-56]|uniref:DUF4426 domain-containing protein n=1 Tax=Motiliproteus sp. SC1-56 TaxID=2799565 RepID=UPI001A8E475B|nr:DUF4426 domain-containing protein [Motiliproteus sp. SC1-56]